METLAPPILIPGIYFLKMRFDMDFPHKRKKFEGSF